MIKHAGGILSPADDYESERLNKFKSGEEYEIEIKLSRNPAFLRKVMVFFHFCFEHYDADSVYEFKDTPEQFDTFRKDLTILAGYHVQTIRLNGEVRTEAMSLSFANMEEEVFQACYSSLIKAALKYVFRAADESVYNKLISFF